MVLRKIAAFFLMMVFVTASVAHFFLYALDRTYLNVDFYQREDVVNVSYDFVVDQTVKVLRSESDMLQAYFDREELTGQMKKVFTVKIFSTMLKDFATQFDEYKTDTSKPLVVSLRLLRENLLTLSNNLVYQIYQELPVCTAEQIAELVADESLIPKCVPENMPYDKVVRPINRAFEDVIYSQIPEELSNIDEAGPVRIFVEIGHYRYLSFLVLIAVLALLALVVYGKISTLLAYLAAAFVQAGGIGYFMTWTLSLFDITSGDERTGVFIKSMLGFLLAEIQKLSILFVGVGVLLLVIRFILRNTIESKS